MEAKIMEFYNLNNLLFLAFQQGAHPSIVGLPQDGGRLATVRPLTMPEPPPLISSTKQGGSITQVLYTVGGYDYMNTVI